MKTVHLIVLITLLFFTVGLYAQSTSQDAINATVNERIRQLEVLTDKNSTAIADATTQMAALRSSLDRFTGIGIGIGSTLTVLQALLIILTYKNGKKG